MEQQVLAWIAQYGYLAIFSLLVLGIVGHDPLTIPGQVAVGIVLQRFGLAGSLRINPLGVLIERVG